MFKTLSKYGSAFAATKPSKTSAIAALAIKTFIVGFAYVILKQGTSYASAADILTDRIILAFAAFFLLKFLGMFKVEPINSKLRIRLAMLSLLYPIGFFLFQIFGIELITASESAIIHALIPVFTLIFSALLIKERTTWIQKVGVLSSILGIVYITVHSINQLSSSLAGYGLTFLSLLTIVLYFIYLKKISAGLSTLSITYYLLKYATIAIIPFYILYGFLNDNSAGLFQRFSTQSYLWIIFYLGVLSTMGTSYLTNYGIKKLTASQVAIFTNLSPITGVLAGVIIMNDPWRTYHVIGGILVFIGIFMSLKFTPNQ